MVAWVLRVPQAHRLITGVPRPHRDLEVLVVVCPKCVAVVHTHRSPAPVLSSRSYVREYSGRVLMVLLNVSHLLSVACLQGTVFGATDPEDVRQ